MVTRITPCRRFGCPAGRRRDRVAVVEQASLDEGWEADDVIKAHVREKDSVDIAIVDSRLCEPVGNPAAAVDEESVASASDDRSPSGVASVRGERCRFQVGEITPPKKRIYSAHSANAGSVRRPLLGVATYNSRTRRRIKTGSSPYEYRLFFFLFFGEVLPDLGTAGAVRNICEVFSVIRGRLVTHDVSNSTSR